MYVCRYVFNMYVCMYVHSINIIISNIVTVSINNNMRDIIVIIIITITYCFYLLEV